MFQVLEHKAPAPLKSGEKDCPLSWQLHCRYPDEGPVDRLCVLQPLGEFLLTPQLCPGESSDAVFHVAILSGCVGSGQAAPRLLCGCLAYRSERERCEALRDAIKRQGLLFRVLAEFFQLIGYQSQVIIDCVHGDNHYLSLLFCHGVQSSMVLSAMGPFPSERGVVVLLRWLSVIVCVCALLAMPVLSMAQDGGDGVSADKGGRRSLGEEPGEERGED